jgi:molecular chaperone DnaK
MAKIIGIDLGTTNSCVAIVEAGGTSTKREINVIPNAEGARTTPSIVGFTTGGDRLVGQVAKRQAETNAEHTVFAVKRLMGRKYADNEVRKQVELSPFKVLSAANGDAWVHAQGRDYSPPEISAIVLGKMKEIAEAFLGEEVKEAVITVPAYFDDAQRQATKDAGRIAGLDVKRILNEPTAAALAYGLDSKVEEKIAVYDLGGGTFDISILQLAGGVFSVQSIGGDTHLGGENFDERIIEKLSNEFFDEHAIDLRKDKMALQRLREASEKAKHELSSSLETEINIPFVATKAGSPLHVERTLKRSELEAMTADLIDRTLVACRDALVSAGIQASDVQNVILVGGMTRMPAVQRAVKELFGREPHKGVNPDEVVAMGAAIQGAALDGQIEEVLLLDVTPLSIGVETGGGVMTVLIPRNTTVPTEASETFTTSVDNQSFVPIHVLQGERDMAADNQSLGKFELAGIPPAPRGVPKIDVTFAIDANGLLQVEAKDAATGRTQSIRITPASGLGTDVIERLVQESERYKQTDKQRRELAELRNHAETLLYTTEQALEGYVDLLTPEAVQAIRADLVHLRGLLAGNDIAALRDGYQQLESAAFKIAESMYGDAPA